MAHIATSEWFFNGIRVIDCATCQFAHLYPFPTETELDEYYRDKYHREKSNFPYDQITDELIKKNATSCLENRNFQKLFDQVMGFGNLSKKPSMLDVGAGNCLLGYYFKEHGWHSTILEPNRDACAYQEHFGVHIISDVLHTYSITSLDKYDFINLQFVLEHVSKPEDILVQLKHLMHDNTILRIQVPNDFSPGHLAWLTLEDKAPSWISYPDHVNYFNFNSLSRLLDNFGFKEVCRDTTFPLELLLLTGQDYYNDLDSKIAVNDILTTFESAWEKSSQKHTLGQIYEALANAGLGRSVIVFSRKKGKA